MSTVSQNQVQTKSISDSERGQVNTEAAEIYEAFFVPALFGEWGSRVTEAANIQSGQQVLDVACGTGALTRAVADRVKQTGNVIGLDVNEGMLAVAQQKAPQLEWRSGMAEALPFEDNQFDAVVSQFGLMFFEDRHQALREMMRVLRPGGHLAVAVWDSLENTPGYSAMTTLLQRLFGDDVAQALQSPYNLGDTRLLKSIFVEAGIPHAKISTVAGTAHFASVEAWVTTDVKGWTLADVLDDQQFRLLLNEAEKTVHPFVTADGTVSFNSPAHIVTAQK